jgi:replicative DNA helicase
MIGLEMYSRTIALRIGEAPFDVGRGTIKNYNRFYDEADLLSQQNLVINNQRNLNQMVLEIKLQKARNNIDIVIIDYMQLITLKGKKNRHEEVGEISRTLKSLAVELQIPIIALAQLSRSVETRGDKMPLMSDLKESGDIEQDADVIGMLFRPEYYEYKTYDFGDGEEETSNKVILNIVKNRSGATLPLKLHFDKIMNRFDD